MGDDMSGFQDRIAETLSTENRWDDAALILEMPKMKAIRRLIIRCAENLVVGYWDFGGPANARRWLDEQRIPESVIEWLEGFQVE